MKEITAVTLSETTLTGKTSTSIAATVRKSSYRWLATLILVLGLTAAAKSRQITVPEFSHWSIPARTLLVRLFPKIQEESSHVIPVHTWSVTWARHRAIPPEASRAARRTTSEIVTAAFLLRPYLTQAR